MPRKTILAVIASITVLTLNGCVSHAVLAPVALPETRKLEVGPIIDSSGMDVAPAIVARLNERKYFSAILVNEPSGKEVFLRGRVRVNSSKWTGNANHWIWLSSFLSGVLLIGGGLAVTIVGIDDGSVDPEIGYGLMGAGGGMLIASTIFRVAAPMNNAIIKTDGYLTVKIPGGEEKEFRIQDTVSTPWNDWSPSKLGYHVMDGIACAIAKSLYRDREMGIGQLVKPWNRKYYKRNKIENPMANKRKRISLLNN